jgi:hypothetical protein
MVEDTPEWRSNAQPFSAEEVREFESRFAAYEYEQLDFDRDIPWPGEDGGAQ